MFRKSQILLLLLCLSFSLSAQKDITGLWRGYNTQDAIDTYSSKYDFEMYLKQDGNRIWGRSYAYIDEIYAEMEIKGTWDGQKFVFEEIKIVNSKADDGMEWCIKKGELSLLKKGEAYRLEGNWSGNTTFSSCTPGKVFLKKIKSRA
ncbi:MAG: hypothetical protein ACI9XO_000773 [Paraglaciecola sp.]